MSTYLKFLIVKAYAIKSTINDADLSNKSKATQQFAQQLFLFPQQPWRIDKIISIPSGITEKIKSSFNEFAMARETFPYFATSSVWYLS